MASIFNQIAPITDHLFLCSAMAISPDRLRAKGITHIVNATIDFPSLDPKHFETIRINVNDVPHAQLGVYFDQAADWIQKNRLNRGKTLVHCMAGVSRSSSICLAFLMKYHKMSLKEAHTYVKKKRPVIRPNCGFWKQLIEFEKKLKGKNSVSMVSSSMGPIPDLYAHESRNMVYVTTYNSSFGRR